MMQKLEDDDEDDGWLVGWFSADNQTSKYIKEKIKKKCLETKYT